jgi:virginiamycin B lyase
VNHRRRASRTIVKPLDELDRFWPVDRINVGGGPHAPDWQAAGLGSIWVSNRVLSVVHQISPRSGQVLRNIHVPPYPCNGLGVAYGSLWVPSCQSQVLTRISARTHDVQASIAASINVGGEGVLGVAQGSVWLTVEEGSRLIRIDAVTNTVVASLPVPKSSLGVATGFGAVWVTNLEAGSVTRVDPGSMRTKATIPTGPQPLFLAVGSGGVWVLNQGDGTLSRIDPATNRVVETIELDLPGPGGCVAADDAAVWISMPGTPLIRIDTATNMPTHRFMGAGGDCLSVGYGSVWLSNHEFGDVWRVRVQA